METNLLDRMLDTYQTARTPVTITLQNKIRVQGRIKAFDSYVIILEGQKREILYRHAVSSVASTSDDGGKKTTDPIRSQASKNDRPQKHQVHSQRQHAKQPAPSTSPESGINNGMKEGLLKWMQEQKAVK